VRSSRTHESGHAIVASVLPRARTPSTRSPSSSEDSGHSAIRCSPAGRQVPRDAERSPQSARRASCGRHGRGIALSEISKRRARKTDLQRATDIARAMVTEFGMSDAARSYQLRGPEARTFSRTCSSRRSAALRRADRRERSTGDQANPDDAHQKARDILSSHREKLELVTRRLLEVEVMERRRTASNDGDECVRIEAGSCPASGGRRIKREPHAARHPVYRPHRR